MKPKALVLVLLIVLTLNNFAKCQESSLPNFPRVKHGDLVFTGIASFKFVIYSDSTVLWSNDGSSVHGEEPQTYVELKVEKGVFSTALGEKPMKPFFYQLLDIYINARLRIWCNTGKGFLILQDQILDPGMIGELNSKSGNRDEGERTGINRALTVKEGIESGANENEEDENEAMFPEEMQKERMKRKADVHGNIPMDALIKAKMHKDRMPAVPSDDAGLWDWEWLGPGDIGGRIRTIAINPANPNIIFIGSVSGGIWRSVNGGSSWSAINDFLPNLSISSIVFDPKNFNTMYAGTGESNTSDGVPGMGIFKSTDGGTTWISLASTVNNNFKYVNRLAHHPDSTGVLYAAAGSKILKSTDGGITWISKFSTGSQARDI